MPYGISMWKTHEEDMKKTPIVFLGGENWPLIYLSEEQGRYLIERLAHILQELVKNEKET